MEQAVEEMKKMQFSPRFVEAIGSSLCACLAGLQSPVNASIVLDENRCIKKIKSYIYLYRYPISSFKKSPGTALIYANEFFSIYRESSSNKSTFLIVSAKEIFAHFNYKEDPIIIKTKINVEGQYFNILFLSFINAQETIAIVSDNADKPIFFTGLPFAITSASEAEVTLECGLKATVSLEQLEDVIDTSLTFSF